jgi:hypothetical protein
MWMVQTFVRWACKTRITFEALAFEAVLVFVALHPNLFVQRPSG